MMRSADIVLHSEPKYTKLASEIGFALQVVAECGRGRASVAAVMSSLVPAVLLKQILFVFDSGGKPLGYVTWAYVSDTTLARLAGGETWAFHPSEWNDGLNLWIADIATAAGRGLPELMAAFRDSVAPRFSVVHGVRRRRDGTIRRLVRFPCHGGQST